ncbi:MAG: V-type ATP synthase subunit A [Nitrososphaerales archaeon]
MNEEGKIVRVSGPVVTSQGLLGAKMFDVVRVGELGLVGEVIRLQGDTATIQIYEDTTGVRPGDKVVNTGQALSVELGPGLLTSIYDGIQRPLNILRQQSGDFISRGLVIPALDEKKLWEFVPIKKKGDKVVQGEIIGTVQETPLVSHKIMIPPGVSGEIKEIKDGNHTIRDPIAKVKTLDGEVDIFLASKWKVRIPRPISKKLPPDTPLLTGQRVFDTFFPVAKGGAAAIPGPFGSGKCVPAGTPVLLANGDLVPIEDLYALAPKATSEAVQDDTLIPIEGLQVLSFDGTKFIPKSVSHVYKGRTSALIRIRTASGKTVTVTPPHKLVRFRSDGRFEECHADKLEVGEYLAVPRRIHIAAAYQEMDAYSFGEARVVEEDVKISMKRTILDLAKRNGSLKKVAGKMNVPYSTLINFYLGRNNPTVKFVADLYSLAGLEKPVINRVKLERHGSIILLPKKLDEKFAEFLGLLLSDGMIAGRQIRFFNNDPVLLGRFKELAMTLFDLDGAYKRFRTVDGVALQSTALIQVLRGLGFPRSKKSQNARIPRKVLISPETVLAAFIRGYYLGDGSHGTRSIEFSSASTKLIGDMSYALGRLGILYSMVGGKMEGRRLLISSLKQISAFLGSIFPDDREYKIPKVESIRKYAANNVGKSQTRDLVPLAPELLRRLFSPGEVYNYVANGERLGAFKFTQMMQNARLETITELKALTEALNWVVLDRIEEVEQLQGDHIVYDITVPDTHNFIGGHVPMILHNTVSQQQLAKWSDSRIIVYVGCGERGNEMTEVLTTFPELEDPISKRPLMERTILVANTSNMPVAAREASIYTGITIAEYYRDMGYDVALMADSTSRWAEALREISGRLEEMPGEEGYPAYLGSRLAEFYERAGKVVALSPEGRQGSVTVVGAVSPPGGDFSEPVSQNTLRVTRVFWALDASLAARRHFPSINWLTSYSLYVGDLAPWYEKTVAKDFPELRARALETLQKEAELQDIVQLVGYDALPETEKGVMDVAKMIREDFLQQSAYDPVDTYTSIRKQYLMMKAILAFGDKEAEAIRAGAQAAQISNFGVKTKISRMKWTPEDKFEEYVKEIESDMEREFVVLVKGVTV